MKDLYNSSFYKGHQTGSLESARATIPLLIERFKPTSVLDVGCGVGTWLSQFMEVGITDLLGLDGDWVIQQKHLIPASNFRAVDLAAPPNLQRRFSITLSLEVAEHLPVASAETFVHFLTGTAPVVVFSAAVPGQGGRGHVNEQWQDYWCNLFERRQFIPVDFIRKIIWDNPKVCWWYAQNLIVYVDKTYAQQHGFNQSSDAPLNLVHPRFLHEALLPQNLSVEAALKAIPYAFKRRLKRILQH